MSPRKILEFGGYISGALLIVFGIIAIYMGVDGRSTVQDSLKQEQIYFGGIDDPAVAKYASEWAAQEGDEQGDQVANGEQARAFAQIIRTHAFEGSENLTYSQMGRYVSAANPDDPAGTSDEGAALKGEDGQPVPNAARNTWVTATALTTALNMSYMAEQLAYFGIVIGIALLLAGIGFILLAFLAVRRWAEGTETNQVTTKVAPA